MQTAEGRLGNQELVTVGMLVAFQMFAGRMSQPLLRLVGLWQEFQQASIAVKRLGDILDLPQEPHALTPSRENQGSGRIDLQQLAFRYSDHHPWRYRSLKVTMLFITHQIPRGLMVDEVIELGHNGARQMEVVDRHEAEVAQP